MQKAVKVFLSVMLGMSVTNVWSAPNDALRQLDAANDGRQNAAVPEPDAKDLSQFIHAYTDQDLEDTKLISRKGGIWKIANVRWNDYLDPRHSDAVRINAGMLKEAYWGKTMTSVGHSFMVFEFKEGGFKNLRGAYKSNYLIISVEGRVKQSVHGIGKIWILSTLEAYASLKAGEGMEIYPFAMTLGNKKAMLNDALTKSVANYDDILFRMLSDNCNLNALTVVNSVLPRGKRVNDIAPATTLKKLLSAGIVKEPSVVFNTSNPGGGLINPR
jgi:hypothetical protein